MDSTQEYELNQLAYKRLKARIKADYPHGRFVAVAGGAVVGDAGSLRELVAMILEQGRDPKVTMAVQAGVDYPDDVDILTAGGAGE